MPHLQLVLKVADADSFQPDPAIEVVSPFKESPYGSQEMTVRGPDGRIWNLQAPSKA